MRPLAEYTRKRNFRATPEPGALLKKKSAGKKLTFVVQEHHASHLHYDFRLEWDGVLKSWAVPKGPSMDPAQKRLAVEVEDHPLDYAKFTGVIPEGNYGAGEVFRWDMGTYEPVKDMARGLAQGRLEFRMKGKKLQGEFVLVRTRSRSGGKPQWLLIKRHDEFAREEGAVEAAAPKRKTKKAPAAKKKAVALPDFIKPQLAQLVDHPPVGADWVHEIKYDGYRIQAHVAAGRVKLFTRNGHDWTDKYRKIAAAFAKLEVEDAIIDGEIVWQDANGRSDFGGLQRAMKAGKTDELLYWAFDLLHMDGKDLTSLPLIARKDRLAKLIGKGGLLRYSDHFREPGKKLLAASCAMNLEGIISKRVDRAYSPGRRDDWVKSKCSQRQEFVIGGFTEGEGARLGFGSLLLGYYEGDELVFAGRVGTGFDQNLLLDIGKRLHKIEIDDKPFTKGDPPRKAHWVKPQLVCEVSFAEWTADRHLRAPVFQGLRADKKPKQIGIEEAKTVERDHVVASASSKVTHPDRLVYPGEKITKQQVADYYESVAKWILPHVADRPLSLLRCQQNSTTGCFFNKHLPKLPEHVLEVPEKGKQPHVAIDSAAGLHALIQNGTLEIHPWNCHRDDIEAPDQIVFDFDPDESVSFAKVKEGALELRDLLKQLGLKSWVKTTGGKGLHVQFPFEAQYDWDAVKSFARTVVLEMVSRHPDLYTANIAKKARGGKIFLDYLRNGRGATAIAPYALRAREKSAVAMPVSWEDLKKIKAGNVFTLEKALAHLRKRRKDPWADYFKTKQKIALLS